MALLTLRNIQLSFGDAPLLDSINLSITRGERICLLGRNGEGKSTLMKLIAGEIQADDGQRMMRQELRVANLPQEVPRELRGRVFDVIADGLGSAGQLVKEYHAASLLISDDHSVPAMARFASAEQALEAADGWQLKQRTERMISRMQLDGEAEFSILSGGMKRRVFLGRALAAGPDLLLLDEPTNHLDIGAIEWLEEFLLDFKGALLFVTHDRDLLQRLATRLIELNRGHISDFPGDYANYLRRREEMDNAERKANARADKLREKEERWIRQGIKARRVRNEGRVRQLQLMRKEYKGRRLQQGTARLNVNPAERSGKLVCEARDITYAWDDLPIIRGFCGTILRGDRIGIIGPNGCGKSTLLGLLLGHLKPDSGQVELGTRIQVAYFDQLREQLKEENTVLENVADGSDNVIVNGRTRHVLSYLSDFLFPPDRCRQPVHALSGGERNRLLLARLFTRPANVLVLDEPTNDLDLETMELLEDYLVAFDGTLLLVSHDRAFLDNAVTSTLVFEGQGRVNAYVGGYQDWLRQRPLPKATPASQPTREKRGSTAATGKVGGTSKKLSYKDQRELEQLPGRIEELEGKLAGIQAALSSPDIYQQDQERVRSLNHEMRLLESSLQKAYERWESLDH